MITTRSGLGLQPPGKKPKMVFGSLDEYRVTYKVFIRNIYDFECNRGIKR